MTVIQHKRGTQSQWSSPGSYILQDGEIGVELYDSDNSSVKGIKIGNGASAWSSLTYIGSQSENGIPTGGTAGQILAKIDSTNYHTEWIDNYTTDLRQVVINNTGSTLYKGQAVYIANVGNSSDTPRVALAKADAESTSSKTFGLLMQDLAHGASGFVIQNGMLSGISGSHVDGASVTIAVGDAVWLSPTVAGGMVFTNTTDRTTKPVAPNHLVYLGVVSKVTGANNSNISIVVKVQNGYEIDELHDVLISSKQSLDVLSYDSSGVWKNKTLQSAGIAALAGATFTGDIAINNGTSSSITSSSATASIFNITPTTVNIGGAATSINLGSTSGTLTINNPTILGSQTTQNLFNTIATTLNIGGSATNLNIGASTGTTTIKNANVVLNGDLQVKGGDITTDQTTFNLLNTTATTLNIGGAATTLNIGVSGGTTNILDQVNIAGGYGSGGVTVSSSGAITANGSVTTDSDVKATGKVRGTVNKVQQLTANIATSFNSTAAWTNLMSVVITTGGNPVLVNSFGDYNPNSDTWGLFRVVRDTSPTATGQVQVGNIITIDPSLNSQNMVAGISAWDDVSSGTYVYYLQGKMGATGTFTLGEQSGSVPTLWAWEVGA